MTKIVLMLAVVLFTLGQVGRISLFGNEGAIYLYEMAMIGFVASSFVTMGFHPIRSFLTITPTSGIFVAYLFLSFFLHASGYTVVENGISLLYLFRLIFYFLFFTYAVGFFRTHHKHDEVMPVLGLSVILIVIGGFVQYVFYPDLRNLFYLGWDPHLNRMFGTFLEPVVYAAIIGASVHFLFLAKNMEHIKWRPVAAGLLLLAFFLTYSRAAIGALFFTMMPYLFNKKIMMTLLIGVVVVVSTLTLYRKEGEGVNLLRTSTVSSRMESYREGLSMWRKDPLFGIGYNRIKYEKRNEWNDNHAAASFHSSFLMMLVTGGSIGLGLFLGSLYEISRVSRYALFAVVFLSAISLFDNILLHPFILFFLFLTVALTVSPSRK
jgi:hypothetical protein